MSPSCFRLMISSLSCNNLFEVIPSYVLTRSGITKLVSFWSWVISNFELPLRIRELLYYDFELWNSISSYLELKDSSYYGLHRNYIQLKFNFNLLVIAQDHQSIQTTMTSSKSISKHRQNRNLNFKYWSKQDNYSLWQMPCVHDSWAHCSIRV